MVLVGALWAQEPNPTQRVRHDTQNADASTPIYHVNVVAKTTQAVNYGHRSDPTKIDFRGTVFLHEARGEARIKSDKGAVQIQAKFKNLTPPNRFGAQYLTYVLWAVTPEGRAANLGEMLTNHDNQAEIETATEFQTFALIVTAEPYFAVTQPSDVVVMENDIRPDTRGHIQTVDAKHDLLKRGQYTLDVSAAQTRENGSNQRKVSLKEYEALLGLYQARNAVQLARAEGADEYAANTFSKAEQTLNHAETIYAQSPKSKTIVTLAREAAQTAEDARLIALRKKNAEQSRSEQEPAFQPVAASSEGGGESSPH
jgi:hypothetical protein